MHCIDKNDRIQGVLFDAAPTLRLSTSRSRMLIRQATGWASRMAARQIHEIKRQHRSATIEKRYQMPASVAPELLDRLRTPTKYLK